MSFGLSRGKQLEPGPVLRTNDDLGPLPDGVLDDRASAYLDPRQWFDDPARPFQLEIGSGKGTFLLQEASQTPDVNFLGVEWAGEFATFAADRLRRHALPNVRMLHTDASEFLHWRMPDRVVSVLHLYFPDPWPKARHHRRRMMQDRFLEDCTRTIIPGGELRIVTDHAEYWAWMESHFDRWADDGSGDKPYERQPFGGADSAGDGEIVGTNFERKYRREGRPFNAAKLVLKKGSRA